MKSRPMKVTTLRLPAELLEEIQSIADEKDVSVSRIIRGFASEGVARRRALQSSEGDDPKKLLTRFALSIALDFGLLHRLLEFPEFRKDILDGEEDEAMEADEAPETD